MTDYLADSRVGKLTLTSLKDYLVASKKCPDEELARANTKFALISLAEASKVELEPLLANIVLTPRKSPGRKDAGNFFGWFSAPSAATPEEPKDLAAKAAKAASSARAGAEKAARQAATWAAENAAAEAARAQQAAEEALRTAKAMEASIAAKKEGMSVIRCPNSVR